MTVPMGVFKSYAHVDPAVDIQDRWLDVVSETLRCAKYEKLLELHTTPSSSISHVRNMIFSIYLAQKWKIPLPIVLKWVEEGIRNLPFSIRRLMRTIRVLLKIGFEQANVGLRQNNLQ